jgi:thiol-disulfide isomerase/thioredoxin
MTIASWVLALLAVTNSSSGGPASEPEPVPVLLDFHADWCGPCQKMRPAVEHLIRKGYPVQSVDFDQDRSLVDRYGVDRVPTFVVVDGSGQELSRTSGLQPAAVLERFYLAARAKATAQPPSQSNAHAGPREDSRPGSRDDDEEPPDHRRPIRRLDRHDRPEQESQPAEPVFTNPHPAETVVRIRILGPHSVGFGSGTIIHSTPQEALILTCAHIFKMEGRSQQPPPGRFPRTIMIDLFDGQLRGTRPAQVHFLETVEGKAVDYDFMRDVGLIRIRPGRRLPASRVVPAHWEPRNKPLPMKMLTLGCSEGNDATAWFTKILNPRMKGLSGKPAYEAMECQTAPKQGRSGGGLFTTDYYLAGVCNFAEPRGNVGLYATPHSIYSLLDRNNLTALYAPVTRGSGTLVADGRAPSPSPAPSRNAGPPIARSQSPDRDESDQGGPRTKGDVLLPHPSLLGIADPVAAPGARTPQAASTTRRVAWHPMHVVPNPGETRPLPRAEPTELSLDAAADHDHFGPPPAAWRAADGDPNPENTSPVPAPDAADAAKAPGKSRWRAIKAAPADPVPATSGE